MEKITQILELVDSLSILELKDLVKALEEKYGVSAAPVAVAGAAVAAAPAEEEKTEFDVELTSFDEAAKLKVIKAVKEITGLGLGELRSLLASSQRDLLGDSDTTLVTNQRHVQALTDARTSLLRVRDGLVSGLPTDLAAQDIREAIYHLGSIVGEISTDEVLGNIFRNFCIGK